MPRPARKTTFQIASGCVILCDAVLSGGSSVADGSHEDGDDE